MTAPFGPADFTDGSAPGSDPYDNPNPEYRRPSPQSSPAAKAKGANAIAVFLAEPSRATLDEATEALSTVLAVGVVGSYQRYDDPVKLASLATRLYARISHTHHDLTRPRLWCDVEEKIAEWLNDSIVGDRIATDAATWTETRERKQLRALLDKYPDEATVR